MIDFLRQVLTTTIYLAGIGSLLLSIPTIIFLYMAKKRKDNQEYHPQNIFLAVMATAVVGGFFFNMI
mgnify:CR=1 FL=1|jgi:RsiW-degrading membrane proteinase PrsW (M82 family)